MRCVRPLRINLLTLIFQIDSPLPSNLNIRKNISTQQKYEKIWLMEHRLRKKKKHAIKKLSTTEGTTHNPLKRPTNQTKSLYDK